MPDVSPSPWGTGRSLYEIPPVMIAAARERSMVLIELCAVVPFERMIEDFHELLVRQRMGTVRAAEPVWQELMGTVLQEQGLNALLDVTARLAGCPASFLDTDDVLVARSRIATAAESGGPTEFEVRGPHAGLGRLVLDGRMNRHRDMVGQRAAIALAIEVGRTTTGASAPRGADSLVRDLSTGVLRSAEELRERLATLGRVDLGAA